MFRHARSRRKTTRVTFIRSTGHYDLSISTDIGVLPVLHPQITSVSRDAWIEAGIQGRRRRPCGGREREVTRDRLIGDHQGERWTRRSTLEIRRDGQQRVRVTPKQDGDVVLIGAHVKQFRRSFTLGPASGRPWAQRPAEHRISGADLRDARRLCSRATRRRSS